MLTACLDLINSTSSHYDGGLVAPDIQKEFRRLQGDLFALGRVKVKINILHAFLCFVSLFLFIIRLNNK